MRLAAPLSPWNPLHLTHSERPGGCAPWSGLVTSSEAGVFEERLTHCVPPRANELKVVVTHAPSGATHLELGLNSIPYAASTKEKKDHNPHLTEHAKAMPAFFLFFRTGKESQCAVIASAREARSAHEGNRSPQTTSEVVGTSPSAPKPPRRSSSDIANVCAAQHDNAVHQRLNQASRHCADLRWFRPCFGTGEV